MPPEALVPLDGASAAGAPLSVVVFVLLLTVIPVAFAARLAGSGGVARALT